MNPRQTPKTNRKLPCIAVLLFGLVTFLVSVPAQTESIDFGYSNGNSTSNGTAPGIKLDLSAITAFNSSAQWELSSFTWLSTSNSGANPTGRGYILIFDADLFSPTKVVEEVTTGKTFAEVVATTAGLIAKSETWNATTKSYSFSSEVILDSSKTYYILNSTAITTNNDAAPYSFGFNSLVALTGIERWTGNGSTQTWGATASDGAPNFSATFAPVPIPEPATVTAILGLAGIALFLLKRRR